MNKEQFVIDMVEAHKKAVGAAWLTWQDILKGQMSLKSGLKKKAIADLAKRYPDGFKDYLIEYLDGLLIKPTPKKNA